MAHWSRFEKELELETRRLISHYTAIQDEEDQNFQMALKFTWSNFKYVVHVFFHFITVMDCMYL